MADVKVPSKLHMMSLTYQKAWYKKHNMEMPAAKKSSKPKGRSAAAAKRVKVEPRKTIAVQPGSVRAINAARQQAYLAKGGRQPIGAMGSGGSNVMAGAGQSTIKDLKASIKAGFNPKVSLNPYEGMTSKEKKQMKKEEVQIDEALSPEAAKRKRIFDLKLKMIKKVANKPALNKPSKFADKPSTSMSPRDDMKLMPKAPSGKGGQYYDEAAKPDASMAMTHQLKMKMISDKDKQTLAKVAALMAGQKNKDKKNAYVRQLGLKAMKAGDVDPARGHSPTRFGREALKKEEVEQIDEIKISDVINATRGKSPEEKQKIIQQMRDKENASKPKTAPRKLEPPKDIPMDQRVYPDDMKYHGDSVELNGPTINEVTTKEAEKTLGGPVKEKPKMPPGKKPAGYRYVRSLARKAMKKGMKEEVEVVEAVKDAADVGEYDYEGDMAKSQLRSILANAKRMHDMLEENTNLPEWVQSKITLAEDYIVTAANYMEGEMNEEVEQVDEISEPYGTKKLRRQMAIDDRMAARDAARPFVEPEWLTKEKEKAKQAAEKAKVKKEEVEQVDEVTGYEGVKDRTDMIKRAAAMNRMGKGVFLSRVKARAAEMKKEKVAKEVKKLAKEEVDLDEAKKQLKPSYWRAEWRLGTQSDVDKNNKKIFDRLAKTDPVKAAAFHDNLMKMKKKDVKEEVVTEAEGKVAMTPKEKALAAHHGDKTKITYGDVIKARIKSAAEKAMKKGN